MRAPRSQPGRCGFTLVELMVVIGLIALLLVLLAPAVQQARAAARRMQCSSNLKNLSLSLANYATTHGTYPPLGRTVHSTVDENGIVLSWVTSILPEIEARPAFDQLAARITAGDLDDPWDIDDFYRALAPGGLLVCPSEQDVPMSVNNVTGRLNYRASLGDQIEGNDEAPRTPRGAFAVNRSASPRDISDGLSNTALLVEAPTGRHGDAKFSDLVGSILTQQAGGAWTGLSPAECSLAWSGVHDLHLDDEIPGSRWADGRPYYAGAVLAAPPNGPQCSSHLNDMRWGLFGAGSRHAGGCYAALADGSVRFISQNIDVGDQLKRSTLNLTGPSPYGLWGALGTRAGGEATGDY